MTDEILKKEDGQFKLKPHMADYETYKKNFDWIKPNNEIEWVDGSLNAAYNAVDRHAKNQNRNKVALIFESVNGQIEKYTYHDLKKNSDKFGNLLRKLGIIKGDRVFLFLPRIPEV